MYWKYYSIINILLMIIVSSESNIEQKSTIVGFNELMNIELFLQYGSISILHFYIPNDVDNVSFVFQATSVKINGNFLVSCPVYNISVYMKQGSLPVISPNSNKFPETFYNLTSRLNSTTNLTLLANNEKYFLNITNPIPGNWFGIAIRPWIPKSQQKIALKDFTGSCKCILTSYASVQYANVIDINTDVPKKLTLTRDHLTYLLKLNSDQQLTYNLNVNFQLDACTDCAVDIIQQPFTIPSINDVVNVVLNHQTLSYTFIVNTKLFPLTYFLLISKTNYTTKVICTVTPIIQQLNINQTTNSTFVRPDKLIRYLDTNKLIKYDQYQLMKLSSRKSLSFSYMITPNNDLKSPKMLNLTERLTILKFVINDVNEIGGTLYLGLTLNPLRNILAEQQYIIVACLRRFDFELPALPNKCLYFNGEINQSPLVLNSTSPIGTYENIYIPYPEIGDWYLSIGLFDINENICDNFIETCTSLCRGSDQLCQLNCNQQIDNDTIFNNCSNNYEQLWLDSWLFNNFTSSNFSLDNYSTPSIVFSLLSAACMDESCEQNGECRIMVDNGILFSTCICYYDYQGWICTDDSQVPTKWTALFEWLLLSFSNLAFAASVYVAVQRYYYTEATVYFFTGIFSMLYHFCDSGYGIYTICVCSLGVLKFCDFYCGLLSIWITIIAMANLIPTLRGICHIAGAILLAFGTVYNMEGILVFIIPFTFGLLILIVSWGLTCHSLVRLYPGGNYMKIHFPSGIFILFIGIVIYSFLETKDNYKYTHSMWHICMATCVLLLLPNPNVLKKQLEDTSNEKVFNSDNLCCD